MLQPTMVPLNRGTAVVEMSILILIQIDGAFPPRMFWFCKYPQSLARNRLAR